MKSAWPAFSLRFTFTAAAGAGIMACSSSGSVAPRSPAQAQPQQAARPVESLTFLHDDFAAARTLSAKRNLPLFVEAFAPW